jgi:hypothetical protein
VHDEPAAVYRWLCVPQHCVSADGGLQLQGTIKSFDTVFLDPHGGDLNGFFLIRGLTGDLIQPRLELWTGMLPPQ